MASLIKHTIDSGKQSKDLPASVEYALHHLFRSFNKPSRNEEIDYELTKNNYSLTPETHGHTTNECMDYYKSLLSRSYIYGESSERDIARCVQWSIQAPADLAEEQKPEFFKACYEYMNELYGEENCIAAVVHTDEIQLNKKGERISKDHLHYLFVPRTANSGYVSANEKFNEGLVKIRKNNLLAELADAKKAAGVIGKFYKGEITRNEAVRDIAKAINCKYAESRKICNAVIRKESESQKFKLCSEAFTSRKQLHEFPINLQQYLDSHGIKCTVSFKSQGIERESSYTVAEAKTVTRITGHSIEEIKTMEVENKHLREQVKSLEQELEKVKNHNVSSGWGNTSGWGTKGDVTWIQNI